VLLRAIVVLTLVSSLIVGGLYFWAKPAPLPPVVVKQEPPAPDHGKQLADNYRANLSSAQNGAIYAGVNDCRGELLKKYGARAREVQDVDAIGKSIDSSGALNIAIGMTLDGVRSEARCKFIWSGGEWLDPEEIRRRKERDAYIASLPKSPAIGMSMDEAERSTWSSPESKNITTTARGKREQWVYSRGRYLYFDNGVLTSIQETR
jgi:hypothetical protein